MGKKVKQLEIEMISDFAGYFRGKRNLDTVVFVHGIGGHFYTTWGAFPELLSEDPDLPTVDILLWGYKTSTYRPFVADTATIGRQLASSLRAQVGTADSLHGVAHSMGGLILLEGITGEMMALRAQEHPCAALKFITLYASPVTGSMAAVIVDKFVSKVPGIRWFANRQMRSLAKGTGVEGLLVAVRDRIFLPKGNDSSMRRIPIRMVMGSADLAVSEADRNMVYATYNNPGPLEYPFDHRAIKKPISRIDDRYVALANDLKDCLTANFQRLCNEAVNGNGPAKWDAEHEIERRYGRMIRRRFYNLFTTGQPAGSLYRFYREMINRHGATSGRPPHDVANRVLMRMRRSGML